MSAQSSPSPSSLSQIYPLTLITPPTPLIALIDFTNIDNYNYNNNTFTRNQGETNAPVVGTQRQANGESEVRMPDPGAGATRASVG